MNDDKGPWMEIEWAPLRNPLPRSGNIPILPEAPENVEPRVFLPLTRLDAEWLSLHIEFDFIANGSYSRVMARLVHAMQTPSACPHCGENL